MSKYKILDNLRRSILPITVFILLTLFFNNYKIGLFALASYSFSTILDILNYIVFKKGKDTRYIYAYKSFVPSINHIKASVIRCILEIMVLPHKAYIASIAILKTIYRMKISKKHLLEWLTADEAEKQVRCNLYSYYKYMLVNLVFGIIYSLIGIVFKKYMYLMLGMLWTISPYIMWYISKDINNKKPIDMISKNDKDYLIDIARKTWQFFKDYMNEENNFLPPDNYQEDRTLKIARKNINNKYWTRINISNLCI